jgi:hypothetical protein
MTIKGVEGLNVGEVQDQVRQGAKFVIFGYCMSFLVITLKRSSDVTFVRAGESAFMAGLPYTMLSLFLGWWGFPWGFIYTPMVLIQNLGGGKDVTAEVMSAFGASAPPPGLPPVQVK